jgi:PKD repeat protein
MISILILGGGLASADINSGLVAYYPFNGNADDASGNGYHGAVYGPTLATDRVGNPNSAYYFNYQDYIEVHTGDSLFNNSFTITVWVNYDHFNNDYPHILHAEYANINLHGTGPIYQTDNVPTNLLGFYQSEWNSGLDFLGNMLSDIQLNTGEWYFVTIVRDNLHYKMYINTNLSDEAIAGSAYPMIGTFFTIGSQSRDIAGTPWKGFQNTTINGYIDDLRIYNRALTTAEIQELYNLGAGSQLTVTHPNGGEVLTKGQDYTITWDSANVSGNIQIDLYKGGTDPANFVIQLAASDPNDGNYPFNPPNDLEDGNDYFIGICAEAGTVWDFSDDSFIIQAAFPPPDNIYDDFNGINIDENKWQLNDENNAMEQYGGILHIDAPPYGAWASVSPPIKFSGDFDVVLYWDYYYQGSVIWINNVPQVLLQVNSENGGFSIVRADFTAGGYYFSEGGSNGNFMGHYGVRTSDTSGRFRITRTGTEVSTYYWNNSWQELLNYQNFVLDDVSFGLAAFTGDNQEAVFHAGFDRIDIIGTPTTSNQPPIIDSFEANPTSGEAPLTVNFTCIAHDPNNDILTYILDTGEEGILKFSDDGTFTYTYNDFGTHQTKCTVVDEEGHETASEILKISLANPNAELYGIFVGHDFIDGLKGALIAKEIYENFSNLDNVVYRKLIKDVFALPVDEWRIKWAIDNVKTKIKPGDILFIYIVGHGFGELVGNDETTLTKEDEYIMLNEAGIVPIDRYRLTDDELTSMLRNMDDIEKWIIVDSCHSGGFWGNPDNPETDEGDLEKLRKVSMFAAADERSPGKFLSEEEWKDHPDFGKTVFGIAIRNALSRKANEHVIADWEPDDGILTFDELVSWVKTEAIKYLPDLEGTVVREIDFGDPILFSWNDWYPESQKSDDFIGTIFTDQLDGPIAKANGPYSGEVGFPITFDAAGSYSPNGSIVLYEWDYDNDGAYDYSTNSPTITHTYSEIYDGTVTLRVTDNKGLADIDSASIDISGISICSTLGNDSKPFRLDWDIFGFYGEEGEEVAVTLSPDTSGLYTGERATLILMDWIRRVRFFEIDRSALPNTITATLPATGKYYLIVSEQPKFRGKWFRGRRFQGDYCLTMESSQGAWQTLEPTRWVE